MTWATQVRTVVLKDARSLWWMHMVLAVLVLLAAADLRTAPGAEELINGMASTTIPMVVLAIIGIAVRLEPPASTLHFWTTQPLRPGAVAAAKLLQGAAAGVIVMAGALSILLSDTLSPTLRTSLQLLVTAIISATCAGTFLASAFSMSRLAAAVQLGVVWFVWYAVFLRTASSLTRTVVTSPVLLLALTVVSIAATVVVYVVRPPFTTFERVTGAIEQFWATRRSPRSRTAAAADVTLVGASHWTDELRRALARAVSDTWRSLAVVVVLVGILMVASAQGRLLSFGTMLLADYAVRIAICYHAAVIIASDPPPSSKSFWSTQPRTPSVVVASTLVQLGVLALIVLIAASVSHSAWRYTGMDRLSAFGRMAEVCAALILPIAVHAGEIREAPRVAFSSAMLGVVYTNAVMDGGRGFLAPVSNRLSVLPSWTWLVVALGLTFLLARAYRTIRPPSGWAYVLVVLPYLLLGRTSLPPTVPVIAAERLDLTLEAMLEHNDPYVWFYIHAPQGLPGDLNRLTDYTLTVTHKDGSTTRMRGLGPEILTRRDGRRGVVRLRGDSLQVIGGAFMNLRDSTTYRDLIRQYYTLVDDRVDDLVSATLDGTIETYESREIERLPLQPGRAFLRDGTTGDIAIDREGLAPPSIHLRTRWLRATPSARAPWPVPAGMSSSELSFALVSTQDRRMLALTNTSGEYYGSGVPLIGFGVNAYDHVLTPIIWTQPKPPVDSTWLSSAALVIGTPVLTATTQVHLSGPVTYSARGRRYPVR